MLLYRRWYYLKKNGFTLVELTAVLIILSVLGMIIIPIVENSINSGKNELSNIGYVLIDEAHDISE